MIIVIGHENPDTDNIASVIAITNLLRQEGKEAEAYKKGNINKETERALEYSDQKDQIKDISEIEISTGQEVFLVDFNEEIQSPIDLSKTKLVGLIDHHKLGGNWKTEEPILFRVEPLGSSSTLAAKIYKEKGIEIPEAVSKLLLCGIISDTLNLSSPTTTGEDRDWIESLKNKFGVDVDKLADSLFSAKSDLEAFTPEEIVKLDYKNFEFGPNKVGIGIVETVKPENVKKIDAELKDVLRKIKEEEKLDLIYLGIVDIIKNQTELLLIGSEEKSLAMKCFSDIVIEGDNLILRGIVSRKKQIVPTMERVLKNN